MIENYNKARRYLYRLTPDHYKDVLHEAFVLYHRRTELNLFEQSNTNVIGVVRNTFYEMLREKSYKKNGVRMSFKFVEYEEQSSNISPIDILIGKEAHGILVNRLKTFKDPELATEIFNLRLSGYSSEEIAKELSINIQSVRRYINGFSRTRKESKFKNKVEEIKSLYRQGKSLTQLSIKFQATVRSIWLIVNKQPLCRIQAH